jgi:cytochrome c oxidase subunit II
MQRVFRPLCVALSAAVLLVFGGLLAFGELAWAGLGQPSAWQIGLQQSAAPVMDDVVWFHNLLLWIITAVVALVMVLLVAVMLRFNARANPVPSRTTHNTLIEVLWTVLPVIILVVIAVPSFRIMFVQLNTPAADLTIKATGKQWFWSYAYPDSGKFEFDSLLACDADRVKCEPPRLLAVDNEMVVPVGKVVRLQVTGADVIHSYALPSFGVKMDAVPGRLNETWFKAEREGTYYGQCSELCGRDHAFMPIAVRVVSEPAFAAWVEEAKKKFASSPAPTPAPVTAAAGAPQISD